nr:MAG TPA: hypothetical protein [Caudoviricetes sp.]
MVPKFRLSLKHQFTMAMATRQAVKNTALNVKGITCSTHLNP